MITMSGKFPGAAMQGNDVLMRGKNSELPKPVNPTKFRDLLPSLEAVLHTVELVWANVPIEIADTQEFLVSCLHDVPPHKRETAHIAVVEYARGDRCRVTVSYTKTIQRGRVTSAEIRKALARV